jgi:hypothetical protein
MHSQSFTKHNSSSKENRISQREKRRRPVHSSLGSPFCLYNPEKIENYHVNIDRKLMETNTAGIPKYN